jgi:hypothetical protein
MPPTIQYRAGNTHERAYDRYRHRPDEAFERSRGRGIMRSDADIDFGTTFFEGAVSTKFPYQL